MAQAFPDMAKGFGLLLLCALYIFVSGCLIASNKYILSQGRFPYPMSLSSFHMGMTTVLSLCFCTLFPSWYPSMGRAVEKRLVLAKFLVPISGLFALSLYAGNKSYMYCGVAFLQFMKESNIAIIFFISCIAGLQGPNLKKVALISWILCGSMLCVRGEVHFVLVGFMLQLTSQVCECSKNVLGEIVLTGNDLKLDALTMTLFQSPMTLVPLLCGLVYQERDMLAPAMEHWYLLVPNAMLAFILNVTVAVIIKNLSAVSFVLCGLLKDLSLVYASSYIFHDTISSTQWLGFGLTIAGILTWSWMKIQEQESMRKQQALEDIETKPLLGRCNSKGVV